MLIIATLAESGHSGAGIRNQGRLMDDSEVKQGAPGLSSFLAVYQRGRPCWIKTPPQSIPVYRDLLGTMIEQSNPPRRIECTELYAS